MPLLARGTSLSVNTLGGGDLGSGLSLDDDSCGLGSDPAFDRHLLSQPGSAGGSILKARSMELGPTHGQVAPGGALVFCTAGSLVPMSSSGPPKPSTATNTTTSGDDTTTSTTTTNQETTKAAAPANCDPAAATTSPIASSTDRAQRVSVGSEEF